LSSYQFELLYLLVWIYIVHCQDRGGLIFLNYSGLVQDIKAFRHHKGTKKKVIILFILSLFLWWVTFRSIFSTQKVVSLPENLIETVTFKNIYEI